MAQNSDLFRGASRDRSSTLQAPVLRLPQAPTPLISSPVTGFDLDEAAARVVQQFPALPPRQARTFAQGQIDQAQRTRDAALAQAAPVLPPLPLLPEEAPLPPAPIPRRQTGGPVEAGKPYVVGEDGEEMFVPAQDGFILPNISTVQKGLTPLPPAPLAPGTSDRMSLIASGVLPTVAPVPTATLPADRPSLTALPPPPVNPVRADGRSLSRFAPQGEDSSLDRFAAARGNPVGGLPRLQRTDAAANEGASLPSVAQPPGPVDTRRNPVGALPRLQRTDAAVNERAPLPSVAQPPVPVDTRRNPVGRTMSDPARVVETALRASRGDPRTQAQLATTLQSIQEAPALRAEQLAVREQERADRAAEFRAQQEGMDRRQREQIAAVDSREAAARTEQQQERGRGREQALAEEATALQNEQLRFANMVQRGQISPSTAALFANITSSKQLRAALDQLQTEATIRQNNAGKQPMVAAPPQEVPEGMRAVPSGFNEQGQATGWKLEKIEPTETSAPKNFGTTDAPDWREKDPKTGRWRKVTFDEDGDGVPDRPAGSGGARVSRFLPARGQ